MTRHNVEANRAISIGDLAPLVAEMEGCATRILGEAPLDRAAGRNRHLHELSRAGEFDLTVQLELLSAIDDAINCLHNANGIAPAA